MGQKRGLDIWQKWGVFVFFFKNGVFEKQTKKEKINF
tara:strand:- start:194 stop:304 length:111 start_codon:yes stop_codon:yes gene_type:complete